MSSSSTGFNEVFPRLTGSRMMRCTEPNVRMPYACTKGLFTQKVTVVGPEHDNRVLQEAVFIQPSSSRPT